MFCDPAKCLDSSTWPKRFCSPIESRLLQLSDHKTAINLIWSRSLLSHIVWILMYIDILFFNLFVFWIFHQLRNHSIKPEPKFIHEPYSRNPGSQMYLLNDITLSATIWYKYIVSTFYETPPCGVSLITILLQVLFCTSDGVVLLYTILIIRVVVNCSSLSNSKASLTDLVFKL